MTFTKAVLSPSEIDVGTFWRCLGQRASAVAVVTASHGDEPAGFFALSAAHVSAEPPTMLVSIDRKTAALDTILSARHFAVNYPAADQQQVVEPFAGKSPEKGAMRFAPGQWATLRTGAPILEGAVVAFDCMLETFVERNKTVIAIGQVVALAYSESKSTLIYCRGTYR